MGMSRKCMTVQCMRRRLTLPNKAKYGSGLGSLVTAAVGASRMVFNFPPSLNPMLYSTGQMQTVLFAKAHDYELIFSREANAYGAFLDSFVPHEPRRCRITDDMYHHGYTVELHSVTSDAWKYAEPALTPQEVSRLTLTEAE